ncbi:MAG: phosphogluconate dehydrogenase (NAD(+)-dependent, decarboxylating) [Longimicrobiales bacterium]
MELGMIGLGRMGANMTERLLAGGHRVVGFDRDAEAVRRVAGKGAGEADSVDALVRSLHPPRAIWLMVPMTAVDATLAEVTTMLAAGDIVVDGGNSNYHETMRRATELRQRGLHYVDVGTSGGIWGLREGYCLMVGGDEDPVERLRPVFETLAPSANSGWGHVGPSGAGHFVKMIHNGVEYGMMQAYAEGFAILDAKREFDFDVSQIAEIWRFGSVVRSWLLDLIAAALEREPDLGSVSPYVQDSGEGRWTVAEAIDLDIPAPVITLALQERLRSRIDNSFADRLLAVMREQFGGHAVQRVKES